MALLTLDIVKRHLRVFHSDDDAEIGVYQAAAESIVVEYLDRVVEPEGTTLPGEGDPGYDQTAIVITPAITAAILLMVGDLYENREADVEQDGDAVLPRPVRALLAPWRVWRTLPEEQPCG